MRSEDTPVSYADIYNSAFNATNKEEWMKNMLKKTHTMSLSRQVRIMRNIRTMLDTQSIMSPKKGRDCIYNVRDDVRKHIQNTHVMRVHRTKRLVRHMLQHTYRPNGRMFRKFLKDVPFIA